MIDRVSKGSRISDEKNKLEAPSLVDFKMDSDSEEDEASDTTNNEKNGNMDCQVSKGGLKYQIDFWVWPNQIIVFCE